MTYNGNTRNIGIDLYINILLLLYSMKLIQPNVVSA